MLKDLLNGCFWYIYWVIFGVKAKNYSIERVATNLFGAKRPSSVT